VLVRKGARPAERLQPAPALRSDAL